MNSFEDLKSQLEQIHVEDGNQVMSSWSALGIKHGFLGVDQELPELNSCNQVHGVAIAEASEHTSFRSSAKPDADGVFTRNEGELVAVKTADCVPVLFHNPKMVMAVHAGWKGLRSGILSQALKVFGDSKPLVAIGPHISSHSFEVGPEVLFEFSNSKQFATDLQLCHISSKGHGDRWHLDLGIASVFSLINAGAKAENISLMRTCTKLNPNEWHSYRRDGLKAGRNWSWISL